MGSVERFFGILIEHYAGAFPLWLAPIQAKVIPITERQHDYARQIHEALLQQELRSEMDLRNEKVGYKIREAEIQKTPYMIILGDHEQENQVISVRQKNVGDLGKMKLEELFTRMQQEIDDKQYSTQNTEE
jgi:threonyl-tRNA synthetase